VTFHEEADMKKPLALTLALGIALPVVAQAQETTTKKTTTTAKQTQSKPPVKPTGQKVASTNGQTTKKVAQVPSQVSAGSPVAAAEKREARTADGPASSENSIDVSKKFNAKKKKTTETQSEGKEKPQS
jgi:hypothetical protein